MRLFIKRFWGFGTHWPIVSFSQKGSLDTLLGKSEPGDVMVFAGTRGDETAPLERGKLLGMAEFGRNRISSRKALTADVFAAAEKGDNGDIKWPHAVPMTRAWRFTDNPLPEMTEVLGRQLPMSAISNAVLLSPEEQVRVMALARDEFNVVFTEATWAEREKIAAAVGPGGTLGPIPTSYTSTVIKDSLKAACTYAYRFGMKNVWKVGWAHDPGNRLAEINKHIPSEVLGNQRWAGGLIQKWATAEQAYAMEQRVLASFADDQRYGERVHCTEDAFDDAWRKARKG